MIGLRRQREAAQRVAQGGGNLAGIVGKIPRPVIVLQLKRCHQVAVADGEIVGDHATGIAELADIQPRDAGWKLVVVMDVKGPRRAEVADIGIVRPL
ncbi:MAG: hypothetical protein EON48_18335, partial [Acetobacteraceae bacterium]